MFLALVSPSLLHYYKRMEESRKHRLFVVLSHPFSEGPNQRRGKGSVSDPYSFEMDPGFDDQKMGKNFSRKKIEFFWDQKLKFTYP
jgi:hypothetical protein